LTIGRHGPLTVGDAREIAGDATVAVAKGNDPVARKQRYREAPTVSGLLAREPNRRTQLSSQVLGALKLLLLTGARLSEITLLKWSDVGFALLTIAFPKFKGKKREPFLATVAALDVLKSLPRITGSAFVCSRNTDKAVQISTEVVESAWQRLRWRAQIEGVHIVCRKWGVLQCWKALKLHQIRPECGKVNFNNATMESGSDGMMV
jgi:integrase